MVKPGKAPNLLIGAIAFAGGGPFWYFVGKGADALLQHFFGAGNQVTQSEANAVVWYAFPIPLWVVLAMTGTAIFAAYWSWIYYFFRWWLPYQVESLFSPRTFREEITRLSKRLYRLSNKEGQNPDASVNQSLTVKYNKNHSYHAHSLCIRAKLELLPEIGPNNDLLKQLHGVYIFTHDDIRASAQLHERLSWLVPKDVAALPRPPIGETWEAPPF